MTTIKVFVGCAPDGLDAESQAVFEWSLRKHATVPVEITWMIASLDPKSPFGAWDMRRWTTPFSGFRWAVPFLCGYQGRAVYSDSDVIWMADVKELHDQPLATGKALLAKGDGSWRMCVSVWDCAAARDVVMPFPELRRDPDSHANMTARLKRGTWVQPFKGQWNCLDGEGLALGDPRMKALHYTSIGTQLQLKHTLKRLEREGRRHWYDGKVEPHWRPELQELFDELLEEAAANGYGVDRYLGGPIYGYIAKRSLEHYQSGPRLG